MSALDDSPTRQGWAVVAPLLSAACPPLIPRDGLVAVPLLTFGTLALVGGLAGRRCDLGVGAILLFRARRVWLSQALRQHLLDRGGA